MAHENAKSVINAYKLTSTKLLQLRVVLFYYLIHHQHIYDQPKEFPMKQKRKWLMSANWNFKNGYTKNNFSLLLNASPMQTWVAKIVANEKPKNKHHNHWWKPIVFSPKCQRQLLLIIFKVPTYLLLEFFFLVIK